MTSPLEGSLAKTIGKAFAATFYAATLTRITKTGGNGYDPASGSTSSVDYPCKGMVDVYSAYDIASGVVEVNDRRILVLATSLSIVPKVDDTITIRGATYRVINVATDPATAVWTIQGRV